MANGLIYETDQSYALVEWGKHPQKWRPKRMLFPGAAVENAASKRVNYDAHPIRFANLQARRRKSTTTKDGRYKESTNDRDWPTEKK